MDNLAEHRSNLTEEDKLRGNLYGFLAKFLLSPPSREMLSETAQLQGDDSTMGQAFVTLARLADATGPEDAKREYEDLFIGVGRGELLPYGSYYLTGFLNEKPLAKLRNALGELGIERRSDVKEPEDHVGTLMEVMEGLILGRFGEAADLETQKKFYQDHIEVWAPHFFADLEKAENSKLYQPLGTVGKVFLEVESTAFSMI